MRYFIRSVKYFLYFSLLTTVIILALVLLGAVEGDINTIFEGGYSALWKIAIFFAVIAAVYPKFGFVSRKLETTGDWDTVKETAKTYFQEKTLRLEEEGADFVSFRRRSPFERLTKMYEDRIILRKTDEGYVLEGLRKEVFLYAAGLEHNLKTD